jgi:hypothetical protein
VARKIPKQATVMKLADAPTPGFSKPIIRVLNWISQGYKKVPQHVLSDDGFTDEDPETIYKSDPDLASKVIYFLIKNSIC